MPELDEPRREAELCGDGGDRPGVRSQLERVDEPVDEADEGGGEGVAAGEGGYVWYDE
jgi:hypothetical protein